MKFIAHRRAIKEETIVQNINIIYNRLFFCSPDLLLCWHSFCDVIVTLCNVSVTFLDVHPRSDSTEYHGIGRGSSDWSARASPHPPPGGIFCIWDGDTLDP